MAEVDREFLDSFIQEGLENISVWEQTILALEQKADVSKLNNLFRIAHNMKGAAKALDLQALGNFIHMVEDVINELRESKAELTSLHIELFFESQKILENWISELSHNVNFEPPLKDISKKVDALLTEKNLQKKQTNEVEEESVTISEDLVIGQLESFHNKITWDENKKYKVFLEDIKIDTAGIQYLLSLKKTIQNLEIETSYTQVSELISLLGLERKVFT